MASASTSTPSTTSGLSKTLIAGIAIAGTAALVLGAFLLYLYVRGRRNNANDEENVPRFLKVQPEIDQLDFLEEKAPIPRPHLGRSVSKRNLTPSVVLPLPAPPIPTARPRQPKVTPDLPLNAFGRPMSSVEIVAHHQATGTMPRPFSPHGFLSHIPTDEQPALRTSSGSISFSCASILVGPLRNSQSSSLRSSLASSGSRTTGPETLKVRHIFTPLLPDELVLRPNEKVTLIQTFEDGWCVVGRKSPYHMFALAKSSGQAFGQGASPDEVEIGAVPFWVFERRTNGSVKTERPMRTDSLGITLLDQDITVSGENRDNVISWSNF